MTETDVALIGGGIVGLASAYQLLKQKPDLKLTLLEKESIIAYHQTGHNSGVIHSGIYYKPGSLKAINCTAGKTILETFCQENDIPYERCGKVVVAACEEEIPGLHKIHERAKANGVPCKLITPEELKELEPHAKGVAALHVPVTGIIDFKQVCQKLAHLLTTELGATIHFNSKVINISANQQKLSIQTNQDHYSCKLLINCAGLYSDRIARMAGVELPAQIVPFRGEYYQLRPEAYHLCRNLIYPVPDPAFPFLGVHFTRDIHNHVECGPNAVLAFAREGYEKLDVDLVDLLEALTFPGFIKLAARHWKMGALEMWRSFSKQAFVKALQNLIPEIRENDLAAAPAGIRAQAVHRNGQPIDDFWIEETTNMIHVCNAPSPAATASLQIGKVIAKKALARLEK